MKGQELFVWVCDGAARSQEAVELHLSRVVAGAQGCEVVVATVEALAVRGEGGVGELECDWDGGVCEAGLEVEGDGWGGGGCLGE